MTSLSFRKRWPAVLILVLALPLTAAMLGPAAAHASATTAKTAAQASTYQGLTAPQRATLLNIARDTWKFYAADVDPTTHLPLDNLTYAGGARTPTTYGRYTSAANIGVYLWAVVAARDLGLISTARATNLAEATLTEIQHLKRYDGFLYQWYDTTTGDTIRNPGDIDCSAEPTPTFDNCSFVSNVDNGWYASGLIVAR
ncbi:MAG TPA: DUF3131 domain-containing protein, partial [Streptosporangiaceae bacterium]|nr:DUF3131 domain-containing protein [Streptosporangiaceae bacterium]